MRTTTLTRILLVDDEPDIRAMASLALEKIGKCTVRSCASGSQALYMAPRFAPDLILLDVTMPDMDGPATLEGLRARPETAAIPVIFLTASVQPGEVAHYKALGAIDVIPKPFDPLTLYSTVAGIWDAHHGLDRPSFDDIAEQLRALRMAYAQQLPSKFRRLNEHWQDLQSGSANKRKTLVALHLLALNVAGSCATFGFGSIQEDSRALERLFKSMLSGNALPDAAQCLEIDVLLNNLQSGARLRSALPDVAVQHDTTPTLRSLAAESLIFIVESNLALAHELAVQLVHYGYAARSFEDPAVATAAAQKSVPTAVIMNTDFITGRADGLAFITKTQQACSDALPIIFVSDRTDLDVRIRAIRAGGSAYFARPFSVNEIIDQLDMLVAAQTREAYRILIVEDEPDLARYYALVLQQAGLTTAIVTRVADFMQSLVDFRPDLILMDLYLPNYNGLELAAMLRQQDTYLSIPIVFLSGETNSTRHLQAMHLGADDFLTKPIDAEHLVLSITARAQRARILRSFIVNDSLTGLLNHNRTLEQLNIELERAQRNNYPLTFAMIDIDNFKAVNDTYGHLTGDRVLKSLARLLRQRLRSIDVIGRYGGEEFGIILTNTDGTMAQRILDGIREDFARIQQPYPGAAAISDTAAVKSSGARQDVSSQGFSVTFSAGIAATEYWENASRLIEHADQALYEVKHSGRNRVMLATP